MLTPPVLTRSVWLPVPACLAGLYFPLSHPAARTFPSPVTRSAQRTAYSALGMCWYIGRVRELEKGREECVQRGYKEASGSAVRRPLELIWDLLPWPQGPRAQPEPLYSLQRRAQLRIPG